MQLPTGSRFRGFFREVKRRRVYTVAVAYVAVSIGLIELGEAVFKALLLPDWASRLLTVLLLLGFPAVVLLAWIFDIGPQGVQRTEPTVGVVPNDAKTAPPATAAPVPAGLRGGTIAPPPSARSRPLEPAPESTADEEAAPPDPERVQRAALAHVRHELKTPINAIIGYSEMLLDDAEEAGDETVGPDLERIRRAGRELLTLVEEILDPERVSADADLESYGVRVRADLRNPINAVTGYAELLIDGCRESGVEWPVPDLERIRTAAYRLLDLSNDIVGLATAAGAESGLSDSSSMAQGVLSKIRPLSARAESAEREGVLLVVDDNAMNRDLVTRQLARKGYQVATAEHGGQALERLAEQPVDLVLLDVLMPEMDGIETLRRMKAEPRLRDVPVIMMSSLDEIDSAIRCMEIGAEDYLTKPVHPTMLDVRIRASLEVRRLREREDYYRSRLEEGEETVGRLLRSVVPDAVAARLRVGETEIVDAAAEAAVLWCGFDRVVRGGALVEPAERAAVIRRVAASLEQEAAAQGVETVVVQDAGVLMATGLPAGAAEGPERLAAAALASLAAFRDTAADERPALRFGLHAGAAAAAVIGADRLAYHVWGDAVDLARRLEAQADAGAIHASAAIHSQLRDRYTFTSRGVVEIPGRGQMRTFLLTGLATAAATG